MTVKDFIDIAGLVASLAAAIGLFLVAWQTKEAIKARQLQATLAVFEDLGSEDNRALRRFVYDSLPVDEKEFTGETLAKVEKLCAAFTRTGILCEKGYVNKDLVLTMYGEAYIRCWDKLRYFVKDARKQHGSMYLSEFEKLAKEAPKHWNTDGEAYA